MFIADFHIHSKYSRATSKDCVPEWLDFWARRKGLDLIGTGDFTHPAWRQELREKLVPEGNGLYTLKNAYVQEGAPGESRTPRFVMTAEISSIYKKGDRVRKVHNVILLPGIDEAEALSIRLEAIGNLHSDGRPILGLDSRDLLEITLDSCPEAIFIPAHIWTPHFSLFGANSGFDTIEECFGDMTRHIHALETGLSSNPPMNWRLSALDRYVLVSNSDAHSPGKLAREANLFDTVLSYAHIARALDGRDPGAFSGTLEFFPEEGKYHFDGHRACKLCLDPVDTPADGRCPICGGKLTIGVLHRVEELADRAEGYMPPSAPCFESLVPLPEVLAASTGWSAVSQKGQTLYAQMLENLGPELLILRDAPLGDIETVAGGAVAEGVRRLRSGDLQVSPGYDGVYGRVSILSPGEREALNGQTRLFPKEPGTSAPPVRKGRKMATKPETADQENPPDGALTAGTNPLEGLNDEQRAAVETIAPVVAVVAGPGTGKTKTLVARIVYLVEERGQKPSEITAVTFTRQAAREMRERLSRHFGDVHTVRSMHIGTFHSICLARMREMGEEPVLIDGGTALALAGELIAEHGWKGSPRTLLQEVSLRKCGLERDAWELPEELFEAYAARLAADGVLDFDDILLRALETALADPSAAPPCFTQLLVDEFQDISPLQYRLIQAWSRHSEGLFVIGDPNQAIYGFRGADARCFERLAADRPDLTTITLHRNYRSTRQILDAAHPLLPRDATPPGLLAERGAGMQLRMVRADTPFSEAVFVAKEIGRLVGGIDMLTGSFERAGDTRAFSDIAVLYRTHRQARLLEECLAQEGIPYVVCGRDDFLSQPETLRLLAFFRLQQNPADTFSLGVCMREIAGLPAAACKDLVMGYEHADGKSFAALLAFLRDHAAEGAQDPLVRLLEAYGPSPKGSPQRLIATWIAENGGADTPWADRLLRTAVYHPSMEDFLAAVTLGQEADLRRHGGKKHSPDAVSLMTLHAAKGLEFPAVFLCGLSGDLMPPRRVAGDPDAEAEERRLLYVGMTRARDELVLSCPGAPSPLLDQLPTALVETGEARPSRPIPIGEQVSLF